MVLYLIATRRELNDFESSVVVQELEFAINPVADLEGVRVVSLNAPLGPNYFSLMGKFMKNLVKC